MNRNLQYQIALISCKGLGNNYAKQLISHYKSVDNFWNKNLLTIHSETRIPVNALKDVGKNELLTKADKIIEECENSGIKILSFFDEDYPFSLKQCYGAPIILYTKGNTNFHQRKNIAIVGSRKMTSYGARFIEDLILGLKDYSVNIISGLAYGCDIKAHQIALENDIPTWAVLAHHLNKIYPAKHKSEANQMLKNGGLISEYNSTHSLVPENFLQRNRIIAGLCDATIIVESAFSGGALVTAKFANEYNREVFALPGRANDELSKGNNHLIKTNQAFLIENVNDLVYHLDLNQSKTSTANQTSLFIVLTDEESKIVNFIQQNSKLHIDELASLSNTATYRLLPILLNLELNQIVRPLPGKFFELF